MIVDPHKFNINPVALKEWNLCAYTNPYINIHFHSIPVVFLKREPRGERALFIAQNPKLRNLTQKASNFPTQACLFFHELRLKIVIKTNRYISYLNVNWDCACVYCVYCVRITFRLLCCIAWMCSSFQRCFFALCVYESVHVFAHVCSAYTRHVNWATVACSFLCVYTYIYSFAWRGGKFDYTHNRSYAIPFPLVPCLYSVMRLHVCQYVCVWAFLFTSVSADKNWIINEGRRERETHRQEEKSNTHPHFIFGERATCCMKIKLSI